MIQCEDGPRRELVGVPPYRTPQILRPLDTNEALFHAFAKLGAFATVQVLELEGALDENRLRGALARWAAMHPRIVSRILDTAGGPVWENTNHSVPLAIVPSRRGLTANDLAEATLNTGIASDGALLSVTWARSGGRHLLCLAIHHSVADGMSAYRLAVDLVDLINDSESPPHDDDGANARTLDDVIPQVSFITDVTHRLDRVRRRLRGKAIPVLRLDAAAKADERATRVLFDSFDAATVSRLRSLGRPYEASIGGILTAAMIVAIERAEGIGGAYDVSTQVSLRKHGNPVIAHTAVGCYAGRVLTSHAAAPFWKLARACTRDVKRAVRRGEPEAAVVRTRGRVEEVAAAVAAEIADETRCGRSCILAISNRGVMLAPRPQGQVRLVKYFSAVANHAVGASLQVSCGTLAGELHCSLMYVSPLVTEARARAIWAAARELLMTAAGSGPG